jgi:predicted transcriptional regulator of viral defense system
MDIMNTSSIRTLSPQETRLLNALSVAGKSVFTVEDARAIANGGISNLARLLSRLTHKRWLLRLERGRYLILPLAAGMEGTYAAHEFVLASRLVQPYAIAYWSALRYHGFTEQVPQTVTVMSPVRRRDVVVPELGFRCHFVYVAAERFFGSVTVLVDDQPVIVTDPARTVLDCLARPDLCGGIVEAAKGVYGYAQQPDARPDRLTDYAVRMGNQAVVKRLGYLVKLLDLPTKFPDAGWTEAVAKWQADLSAGFVRLDPRLPPKGPYDRRWRLRLNVPVERLLAWMQT